MSIKKIVLIAIAASIGVVALFFGSMMFKFKTETASMSPVATGEVVPGVFAIKDDFLNMYLVRTAGGYIAFDAGNDTGAVAGGLKMLGIAPSDVRAVFLTHTDGDHIAGIGLFPDAEVYIGCDEEQMINGTTARGPFMKNSLEVKHSCMNDGQAVTKDGTTITAIFTPGHTAGSACYLVNGEDLFTGDTLSIKMGRIAVFNEFFNMDTESEKKSITKIKALPGVKRIFTAHYGYVPDFAGAFAGWE